MPDLVSSARSAHSIAANSTHRFIHSRSTLSVPSLNAAVEPRAGIKDIIEVFLVCHWARRAVGEAACSQGAQRTGGILIEKGGDVAGLGAIGAVSIFRGGLEVHELQLDCIRQLQFQRQFFLEN